MSRKFPPEKHNSRRTEEPEHPAIGIDDPLTAWRVAASDADGRDDPEHPFIEGEQVIHLSATNVSSTDRPPGQIEDGETGTQADQGETSDKSPKDLIDPALIMTVASRQWHVNAGGSLAVNVTLLNNGDRTAHFNLLLDGEFDLAWCDPVEQTIQLQPGEGSVLTFTFKPPRSSVAQAGDYAAYLYLRSPEYPGRFTELCATLAIQPFQALSIGEPKPQTLVASLTRRILPFALPLSNLGNTPVHVQLQGADPGRTAHYWFPSPQTAQMQRAIQLSVAPGQTTWVKGYARLNRLYWVGLRPRGTSASLALSWPEEERAPQRITLPIYEFPVIGPGAMALIGSLFALMILCFGMLTVMGLWIAFQRSLLSRPTPSVVLQSAAAAAPVQAPIVIVLDSQVKATPVRNQADAPVRQPAQQAETAQTTNQNPSAPVISNQGSNRNGEVPVITAADVTTPGEAQRNVAQINPPQANPAQNPPSQSVAANPNASQEVASSQMSYAQMFQAVALRYDLDWRLLAAQAYVESGFDPVALGKDGDMGLMQILPNTWNEWAPIVGVKDPFESYSNTLVAAAYLDYLRSKLSERGITQREWMLVAYNWGPDKVFTLVSNGGDWNAVPATRRQYAEEIVQVAATIP